MMIRHSSHTARVTASRPASRSFLPPAPLPPRVSHAGACRAKPGDGGSGASDSGSDFESLFAKELQRRGLESTSSVDDVDVAAPAAEPSKRETVRNPAPEPFKQQTAAGSGGARARTRPRAPPPESRIPNELDGQRERSFSIVNEGLSGLIPRVSQLFQLGGSIFLGFLPFMLAFSLLFTGVYAIFGDSFLHSGRTASMPAYMDPQDLLSAPTVDPYIPLR